MSDASSPLPEITSPERRRPGRKPGCERIPGSGRKAGSRNKVPGDLKEMILTRGKPIELLCDISRGVKIRVGPQAGPGASFVYPSLAERAAAAKILCDKLLAAATPPSDGADGAPLHPAPDMDDMALARLVAYSLTKAAKPAAPPPVPSAPPRPRPVDDGSAQVTAIMAEPAVPVPPLRPSGNHYQMPRTVEPMSDQDANLHVASAAPPDPRPVPEATPPPMIHTPLLLRRAND